MEKSEIRPSSNRLQPQPLFSVFQIGLSIHHFNKVSERRLGLSLVQWCVLKSLIDMPMCSAHALSSAVGVHPSTLTQTLKRLERKKRVYVTEDPKDSRRKLITITREGKRALDHAQPEMQSWESRLGRLKSELQAVQSALSGG